MLGLVKAYVHFSYQMGLGDASSEILDLVKNILYSLMIQLVPQNACMVPHITLSS